MSKKAAILTNQLFDWRDLNSVAIGGGERVTLRLSDLLNELGYDVHVYQWSPKPFTKTINDITVHGIHDNRSACNCFYVGLCDIFYELTRDFDKVIINLPEVTGGAMRDDIILITHGIYWCGKSPEDLSDIRKRYLYSAWNSAEKNVIIHEIVRDAIRQLGFNEIADEAICIENYVDTDLFKPSRKEKIILFPGRAEKIKGTDLIRGILDKLGPCDWRVVWCGGGSQFDELKSLENRYPRFSAISLPMDEIYKLYSLSSICVVINTGSKGNSLTLVEGMASGCACIGIDGGTDIVGNGIDGILCSVDAISDSIKLLVGKPKLREKFGKAAREKIIRTRSKEDWERKWIDVIGE